MLKRLQVPKFVIFLCSAIALVIVVGAVGLGATNRLGSSDRPLVGQVPCALATACDGGKNTGTGPGVQGDSTHSKGVVGNTTLVGTATAHTEAILGADLSTTGTGNFGVVGTSPKFPGVAGFETVGPVQAVQGDNTVATAAGAGVAGFDANITGTAAHTGLGVFGDGGLGGVFVGESAMAHALELDVTHGGFLLRAFKLSGATSTEETSLDSSGNFITKGSVTAHGTPGFVSRTSGGAEVVAYGPRQTQPTMEDVGEARLINGQGFVRMDPAFASAIDRAANYLVFITPKGDSRGLYVSQQSAAGFAVRENQGGHSSLAFDYRIVGKPFDSNQARLPLVTQREALTETVHAHAFQPYTPNN